MKLICLMMMTIVLTACGKNGSSNSSDARRDPLNSSCHVRIQSHDPEELILKGYQASRDCGLTEDELKMLI